MSVSGEFSLIFKKKVQSDIYFILQGLLEIKNLMINARAVYIPFIPSADYMLQIFLYLNETMIFKVEAYGKIVDKWIKLIYENYKIKFGELLKYWIKMI